MMATRRECDLLRSPNGAEDFDDVHFAGCPIEDILASIGLTTGNLFTQNGDGLGHPGEIDESNWPSAHMAHILAETIADPGRIGSYLGHRGLSGRVPAVLRFHRGLTYRDGEGAARRYPAIIAPVARDDGTTIGLLRVYLDPVGPGKAPVANTKKALGKIKGGAIRLTPAGETLALTEGIETGLAVQEATDTAVWAAGSASNFAAIGLPEHVRTVEIWGDRDASETGQQAAEEAAKRFHAEGREVRIILPPEAGRDWLDVLVSEGPDALLKALREAKPLKPPDLRSSPSFRSSGEWPDPLAPEAFYGLAGDIVRTVEPHSEADPAALLVQTLVAFGNVIGRRAHYLVEGAQHYMNLFAVLVGLTAKGRKGTSLGRVLQLFDAVDLDWRQNRVTSGLSSGEGLIWAVRDPIIQRVQVNKKGEALRYEDAETDPGEPDCTSSESSGPFGLVSKSHSRHVALVMPRSDSPACAAPASRV
jgi:hypothetical protein